MRRSRRSSSRLPPPRCRCGRRSCCWIECHGELLEWRNSIETEYGRVLRSLLTRVGLIFIALLFVFFLSEIWRRATYRYIHDARRRRQLMLIRRVVTGFLMVVVIAMGFISEFSSLATFAGIPHRRHCRRIANGYLVGRRLLLPDRTLRRAGGRSHHGRRRDRRRDRGRTGAPLPDGIVGNGNRSVSHRTRRGVLQFRDVPGGAVLQAASRHGLCVA